jgi:hypothetical protein
MGLTRGDAWRSRKALLHTEEGVAMGIETDSSNQKYIEVPTENGEKIRVTLIENSWATGPGIRIQVRNAEGHLRQGPEIPAAAIGKVVGAVVDLVRK